MSGADCRPCPAPAACTGEQAAAISAVISVMTAESSRAFRRRQGPASRGWDPALAVNCSSSFQPGLIRGLRNRSDGSFQFSFMRAAFAQHTWHQAVFAQGMTAIGVGGAGATWLHSCSLSPGALVLSHRCCAPWCQGTRNKGRREPDLRTAQRLLNLQGLNPPR